MVSLILSQDFVSGWNAQGRWRLYMGGCHTRPRPYVCSVRRTRMTHLRRARTKALAPAQLGNERQKVTVHRGQEESISKTKTHFRPPRRGSWPELAWLINRIKE